MINSIIIALLLLNSVKESQQQAWHTANMLQRMTQRCFGAGCSGWVYRPVSAEELFNDVYRRVEPDIQRIIHTKRAEDRFPPGYGEGWKKKKGETCFVDPDGYEWREDKLHEDHWDVSCPKTGNKIKEVAKDGRILWPDGPKNKNK
jgi:hypothetical protein